VFTAGAALTVFVAALLLLTGNPKASIVTNRAAGSHVATSRRVLQANLAAPVEWILLVLAIAALGFAAWLWTSWGRSRQTAVAA
jgi:hypothetical protein